MEPLENSKQLGTVTRVETDAIVAHEKSRLAPSGLCAHLDAGFRTLAGIFQGIAKEIDEGLPERHRIRMDGGEAADFPDNFTVARFGPQSLDGMIHEGFHSDGDELQFRAAHLGECEQVVDKVAHLFGGTGNNVEQFPIFRIEFGAGGASEHFRKTINVPERGAQIVRNGIAESLQFFISGLELDSALENAILEFGVELANLLLGALALGDVANHFGKASEISERVAQ